MLRINLTGTMFAVAGLFMVVCKLGGIAPFADWSWALVTLPWWISVAVVAAFVAAFIGVLLLVLSLAVVALVLYCIFLPLGRWWAMNHSASARELKAFRLHYRQRA